MPKKNLGLDVYTASRERIAYVFDNFERIYLSFSAGKDSTVMLHMVCDEAIKRNKKIGILLIDLEAQYKLTIQHALKCYEMYKDIIEPFWVCLPLHLRNAVSQYDPHWICWDEEQKDFWVRDMPKKCIGDTSYFPFFKKGMEFEEFVPKFGEWYGQGKSCACFVGIRTDESLNRYRTIASSKKETFDDKQWTTKVSDNLYNIYPIYDWRTKDLWLWHSKNTNMPYNELYDRMHLAGLTISQMRICQPYGDDQRRGLWLYHIIEPETWSRVVKRVSGANSGALYIQEKGNMTGYNKISKPDGHTWESFAKLLLSSMPDKSRKHFLMQKYLYL